MADKQFLVNLDLNGQQIKNVLLESVDSLPEDASVSKGRILYLTTDDTAYVSDGTAYQAIATVTAVNAIVAEVKSDIETELEGYVKTEEKGAADGVASLDGDAKIPVAQIPSGNAENAVVVLAGTIGTGEVIVWDGSGFTSRSLANIYVYKGSVGTYEELPAEGNTAGDVYNVVQAHGDTPAGTNYAWNGTAWDALGGSIDTSIFQLVSNIATDLASPSDTTYPSTQAVSTALQGKVDVLSSGPTAGTYTKVVITASGLVSEGGQLTASDIPDISETYVRQDQIGVGDGGIPTVDGTAQAGYVIAVNGEADGYELVSPSQFVEEGGTTLDMVGDDSTTEFVLPHGLGHVPRSVQVCDADGNEVGVLAKRDGTNVTISVNVALPTGTTYKVYVI